MVSQNSSPLVVIGLPIFNEAQHLSQALDSILGPTYKNIRHYVSDTCSDDGTDDICSNYAKKKRGTRQIILAKAPLQKLS